jgi:hypothetical protein
MNWERLWRELSWLNHGDVLVFIWMDWKNTNILSQGNWWASRHPNQARTEYKFIPLVAAVLCSVRIIIVIITITIRRNHLGNQISHSSKQHGIQFRPAKRVFCVFSHLSYHVLGKYWERKYREVGHYGFLLFFPINDSNHRSMLYNRSAWKADDQSRTWKETFLFCVKTLSQQLHGETEDKDENMSYKCSEFETTSVVSLPQHLLRLWPFVWDSKTLQTNKLRGLSPRANDIDRATAACRRS